MWRAATLYDKDYYAWALAQAQALRDLAAARWNGPLDLAHLAEEVEDLGKAERNSVLSQTERLIEHLLKLEYARERDARNGWIASCDDARHELERHLTASLRRELEAALPEDCPYPLARLLDEDWLPRSRHGWVDAV
jgi:hypothetical protein